MRTSITDRGDIKIIEIQGKITIGEGDIQMRKAINEVLAAGSRNIVLDLGGVRYIDSSGIGELVSCYTTCNNRGGQLLICNIPPNIYSLLQLTGLLTVFQIHDSVEDAMQAFN